MYLLLYSGIIYLFGVALALFFRPAIMFSPNGAWKEFGIGRNKNRYTWFPFWMFAILWAIISYLLVFVISARFVPSVPLPHTNFIPIPTTTVQENEIKNITRRRTKDTLRPGYYILNASESAKKGMPKYVYLGEEAPNLMYNYTGPGDEISHTSE